MFSPYLSFISITAALISFSLQAQSIELLPHDPLIESNDLAAERNQLITVAKASAVNGGQQPQQQRMLSPEQQSTQLERNSIVVRPELTQPSNLPRKPDALATSQVRQMNGKLVRRLSNFGPRYPIRLRNEKGNRLAYVDMSHFFIHDLRPYLDQQVSIQGEVHPLVPGSQELVVVVRTLRILP